MSERTDKQLFVTLVMLNFYLASITVSLIIIAGKL